MKILFVQPPVNTDNVGLTGMFSLHEPLALETVAASVPGHQRKILDMRLGYDLEQELTDFNPDVVATTSYTPEVYRACKVMKKAKEFNSDILTVVGGHHATIMPQDFQKEYVDVIVIGDGEITFSELIDVYEAKGSLQAIPGLVFPKNGDLLFNPPREMIHNLDQSPLPSRDLTAHCRDKYFRFSWRPTAALITSRGCAFRCKFCSVWKHEHGKFRTRSAERVVEEIMDIKEKY